MALKFQKLNIPDQVMQVLKAIESAKSRAYIVGACVYELLRGEKPRDYDIITNADYEEMSYIFRDMRVVARSPKLQLMMISVQGMIIQVSTYRSGIDEDGNAIITDNFLFDLAGRNFTVNAIAYHPRKGYKDPFDGKSCVNEEKVILKAIGEYPVKMWENNDDLEESSLTLKLEPQSAFIRRPLDILEALTLLGTEGFETDDVTSEAIRKHCGLLLTVPKNELLKSFTKLISSRKISSVMLRFPEVFSTIIPQLKNCIEFQNTADFGTPLYEHIAKSLEFSPPQPESRYAMLFHNTGMPDCLSVDKNGNEHYFGHAERARIYARMFFEEYKAEKKLSDETDFLIENHDIEITDDTKCLKRLLNRFEKNELLKLIKMRTADDMAKKDTHEGRIAQLRRSAVTLDNIINSGEAYRISMLTLSERDLIRHGFVSNLAQAELLIEQLFELVIEQPKMNSAPVLLDYLRKNLSKKKA